MHSTLMVLCILHVTTLWFVFCTPLAGVYSLYRPVQLGLDMLAKHYPNLNDLTKRFDH